MLHLLKMFGVPPFLDKAHEVLCLEMLTLLLERPTDDSIEVAIGFLKDCGLKLTEVSPRGVNGKYMSCVADFLSVFCSYLKFGIQLGFTFTKQLFSIAFVTFCMNLKLTSGFST